MADVTRSRLKSYCLVIALSASALLALTNAKIASLDAPDVYAIKDAQIITGTGKVIARGTVVIRNGLITEVGENARIPADARVINGTGMTVYPGLIDGYTNVGLPAPQPPAQRPTGGGGGGAAQAAAAQLQPEAALGDPSLSAADQVRPGGSGIEDARSAGVTAALTSPRQGIFAGQSALINLAGSEPSKMVVRAPVALIVQFSTSPGFFGQFPNSLMGTVSFIRQSFYDALHYRDEQDRYNRVKRGVSRPQYDKKLAALQPALRGDLPVLFVANSDGDIHRALRIADEFKLRPIIAGAMYSYRVADLLRARNVPVILSVDFPKRTADLPEDEDEPLRLLRDRAEAPRGAARLAQAGVKFAFMSGSLRPQDFVAGVQRAVENGLSKDEAIKALTINAAEILGAAEQLGSVEVGKIANLVVTSGDLLARDGRVRHVFIDGNEIELRRPDAAAGRVGARPGAQPGQQPAAAAAAVDPSGQWSLVVRTPQGDQAVTLTLQSTGGQINGTLATPQGTYQIKDAAMTGNQLRFGASIQIGTDTMEAVITGTIEGDSMRGVVSLPALGSFEFTGNRPR